MCRRGWAPKLHQTHIILFGKPLVTRCLGMLCFCNFCDAVANVARATNIAGILCCSPSTSTQHIMSDYLEDQRHRMKMLMLMERDNGESM